MENLPTLHSCGVPPLAHVCEMEQLKSWIMADAIAKQGKQLLVFFGCALAFQ